MLADACRHAKTKVGIDIDLADSACRRLAELLLGNADGILEGAAVGIDDLYIFLRNRGGSVKDDRESGKSSCHFLQNIKAQLGIRAGFEFVSAVAGSDRDRQGINAGPLDKFLDLIGICEHGLVSVHLDRIFDACQCSQLSLYDDAVLMRILGHTSGLLDILLEGMAGIVNHDGSKATVHALFADIEICAVIQVQGNGNLRIKLHSSLDQLFQIHGIGVLAGAGGSLQDHRGFQLCSRLGDRLDDLHVVDIECADCIAAIVCLFKHLCSCYQCHLFFLLFRITNKNAASLSAHRNHPLSRLSCLTDGSLPDLSPAVR